MHYSIEQDEATGKYCVYDSDSGEKLSEWDTRREATREMGRLQREEGGESKKKQAAEKDEGKPTDD